MKYERAINQPVSTAAGDISGARWWNENLRYVSS
jgi:hypothetical protein